MVLVLGCILVGLGVLRGHTLVCGFGATGAKVCRGTGAGEAAGDLVMGDTNFEMNWWRAPTGGRVALFRSPNQ